MYVEQLIEAVKDVRQCQLDFEKCLAPYSRILCGVNLHYAKTELRNAWRRLNKVIEEAEQEILNRDVLYLF